MKNPHTLPRLREIAARASRSLSNPRVTKNMPDKVYNELASAPGLTLTFAAPSVELPTAERARIVLGEVTNTLRRHELAAAREFAGRDIVVREREVVSHAEEAVEQLDALPGTVVPGRSR